MARTTGTDRVGGQKSFSTTHWSVVLAATQTDGPGSLNAWERLATIYWPPLYAYIRRSGRRPADAQDLTQSFFAALISRQSLEGLVPGKGRFRSYLLVCLKNFVADEHRRAQAARRRPETACFSLDTSTAEGRYQAELVDHETPESIYERQWAAAMVDHAISRLEAYYLEQGKGEMFECLAAHLVRDPEAVPHAELAARLGSSEGAVKNAMYRLRQRFRAFFRKEVAATVAPDEVEDEIRHIHQVLAR